MILLLKYFTKQSKLKSGNLIIYILFLIGLLYINFKIFGFIIMTDMYLFMILSEFNINADFVKNVPQVKMEIVAEGSRKAETDNLAKILIDYNDKFIK